MPFPAPTPSTFHAPKDFGRLASSSCAHVQRGASSGSGEYVPGRLPTFLAPESRCLVTVGSADDYPAPHDGQGAWCLVLGKAPQRKGIPKRSATRASCTAVAKGFPRGTRRPRRGIERQEPLYARAHGSERPRDSQISEMSSFIFLRSRANHQGTVLRE